MHLPKRRWRGRGAPIFTGQTAAAPGPTFSWQTRGRGADSPLRGSSCSPAYQVNYCQQIDGWACTTFDLEPSGRLAPRPIWRSAHMDVITRSDRTMRSRDRPGAYSELRPRAPPPSKPNGKGCRQAPAHAILCAVSTSPSGNAATNGCGCRNARGRSPRASGGRARDPKRTNHQPQGLATGQARATRASIRFHACSRRDHWGGRREIPSTVNEASVVLRPTSQREQSRRCPDGTGVDLLLMLVELLKHRPDVPALGNHVPGVYVVVGGAGNRPARSAAADGPGPTLRLRRGRLEPGRPRSRVAGWIAFSAPGSDPGTLAAWL